MEKPIYRQFYVYAGILIATVFLLFGCSQGPQSAQLTPADYPEHTSEPAQLYLSKCSGCHAAPLPSLHTARRWSGVVERMQMRMKNKAITPLNSSELPIVLGYLQKHARK